MAPACPVEGFIDGHVDILYEMMRNSQGISLSCLKNLPVTLDKIHAGRVKIIVAAIYCADAFNGACTAAAHLRTLMDYASTYLEGLAPIRSARDLMLSCSGKRPPGTIFLIENSDALLETDPGQLKQSGIRVAGLTHAGKNRIADGNSVSNPRGLTPQGFALLRRLDIEGFAVDLAHLSDPAFAQVLDIFHGPLLSSHTGFRRFYDVPRNLSDEQLRLLVQRGGIVGVAFNPEMLSNTGTASIYDVFHHIDHVVQRWGPDHAAIGSDFCGYDLENSGLEDISKLPNLASLMEAKGYPSEAIEKIMGGNWARFYSMLFSG